MDPSDAPTPGPSPAPRASSRTRAWIAAGVAVAAGAGIWAYLALTGPSLIGVWSNRAPQNAVTFVFREDGSGAMSIGASQLPYQYRFDESHEPAWLDLDARPEGRAVTIRAIAEFSRGGKLMIRMPHTRSPGERPTEFIADDVENTILLTRIESPS